MKNTLKYLGLILIFSIIGFLLGKYFFDLSLSQIAKANIQVSSRNMSGQFFSHSIFAFSIGILPLLYLIIKKVTKLNFINQGLISCGIVIGFGVLLWQFRIFQLNLQAQILSDPTIENGIKIQMDFDNLNFELYLFFGFIIGTIVSILIFKNSIKKIAEQKTVEAH